MNETQDQKLTYLELLQSIIGYVKNPITKRRNPELYDACIDIAKQLEIHISESQLKLDHTDEFVVGYLCGMELKYGIVEKHDNE